MQRSEWIYGSMILSGFFVFGAALGCSHQSAQSKTHGQSGALTSSHTSPTLTQRTQGDASQRGAKADFVTLEGENLAAVADLEEVSGGVRIEVAIDGAKQGAKGVHIHEKGDCTDIAGKSMGEHFALADETHGLPTAPHHHLGDLGNVDIAQNGDGRLIIVVPGANLEPDDTHSFAGRSIVIHESEDIGTGPSGHSGEPIACAVIMPQ